MISGLGMDIVNVGRMEHWPDVPGIIERFFHPREIETARNRGSAFILSLAARFAAKEAFGKALGTGLKDMRLADIEVVNNHNGRPGIILHRTALRAFDNRGGGRILVSLTHEKEIAAAVVIIEEADGR